ncbi:SET domain-containing protein-lysine N-methyltransferase [Candidatus Woesearchaeota archaeon]|nr:SET domain-containing protein-lysine N-methyltransferase [Candidatus Woesearchaeota archaeon]
MKTSCLNVRKSKNGNGVFADKNFEHGEVILYFEGKFLDDEDIEFGSYEDQHGLQIDKRTYLVSYGLDDFINHSCSPNCGVKEFNGKFILVAIRSIKKFEEITFDYSTWADYSTWMKGPLWKMKCSCGSKNCRDIILDFKFIPLHLKKKYIKLGMVPKYTLEKNKK